MQKLIQKYSKISENLIFWSVIFLIVFIPLYMKYPTIRVANTFVSVRLEDFIILFAVLSVALHITLNKDWKKLINDSLFQSIALFFFVAFVSVFSAVYLTKTVMPHLVLFHYFRRIELVSLIIVGIWAGRKKEWAKTYFFLFGVVTAVIGLYALGQRYLGFPAVSTTNSELSKGVVYYLSPFDRITSTFAGHYDLAIYLMMALSIISGLIFYFLPKTFSLDAKSVKKINWKKFLPLISLAVLSFVVLIMTAARVSFVAAVSSVLFALIILKKRKLILVALFIGFLVSLYPSQLRNRLVSTVTINLKRNWTGYEAVNKEQEDRSQLNIPNLPTSRKKIDTVGSESADIAPGEPINLTDLAVYRSFEIRTQIEWPRAIRAFVKNPLLGTGYSSITLATDNDILRSLGEVGLLGTASFALVIFIVIKRVWKKYKTQKGFIKYLAAGTLALIFGYLVNSLFIDVFEASKVASLFWLTTGITLGLKED